MSIDTQAPGARTRWSLVAVVLVPVLGLLVLLSGAGPGTGVLAASFVPGEAPVTLRVADVVGERVGVVGAQPTTLAGDELSLVDIGLGTRRVRGVCLVLPVPVAALELVVTGRSLEGVDLEIGTTDIGGSRLAFEQIVIGRDAAALQGTGLAGPPGTNGIEAASLSATDLEVSLRTLTSSEVELQDLDLTVRPSGTGC